MAVGTPNPQGSPNPGSPGPDVSQSLEEALRGIDKDFSEADALHVLDLLDQANQRELGAPPSANGRLPDY